MVDAPKSLTEEIRQILAVAGEPLTVTQIFERSTLAAEPRDVASAIYNMRARNELDAFGVNGFAKTYALLVPGAERKATNDAAATPPPATIALPPRTTVPASTRPPKTFEASRHHQPLDGTRFDERAMLTDEPLRRSVSPRRQLADSVRSAAANVQAAICDTIDATADAALLDCLVRAERELHAAFVLVVGAPMATTAETPS